MFQSLPRSFSSGSGSKDGEQKVWSTKLIFITEGLPAFHIEPHECVDLESFDFFEDEDIIDIELHECPLKEKQGVYVVKRALGFVPIINVMAYLPASLMEKLLNHVFVIFKTKQWIYLLSKGPEGIQMRRERHQNLVILLQSQWQFAAEDYSHLPAYLQGHPPDTQLKEFAKSDKKLSDLMLWLISTNQFYQGYSLNNNHCQTFAAECLDFIRAPTLSSDNLVQTVFQSTT